MAVTPFHQPYPETHATGKRHDSVFYRTGVIADGSFKLREQVFLTNVIL